MGRLGSFVAGVVVGAGAVFGSLKYHVLRTNDGIQLIPKVTSNFSDTYVDIRHFGLSDWEGHKGLVAALVHANKESLMGESAAESFRDGARNLLGHLGLESPDRAAQR